jgi:hypothetical protein
MRRMQQATQAPSQAQDAVTAAVQGKREVGAAPACEMRRAPTTSPMSALRLGAIACILSCRYACSCSLRRRHDRPRVSALTLQVP